MLKELPDIDVVVRMRAARRASPVGDGGVRAGKHVYCEHPLGISTRTGAGNVRRWLAQHKACAPSSDTMYHYEPAVLANGRIGALTWLHRQAAGFHYLTYFHSGHIAPLAVAPAMVVKAEVGRPAFRTGQQLRALPLWTSPVLGRTSRTFI